jgi:hypothetical protein
MLYLSTNQIDSAIADFDFAIAKHPTLVLAHQFVSLTYFILLFSLNIILLINFNNRARAQVLLNVGRLAESAEAYLRVVDLAPQNNSAHGEKVVISKLDSECHIQKVVFGESGEEKKFTTELL